MTNSASELTELVRGADDEWLLALLEARPDLARPVPSSLTALAGRAGTKSSAGRALASLCAPDLAVAEAAVILASTGALSTAALTNAVGLDSGPSVARLRAMAVLLGSDDTLHPAPGLAEAVGATPLGLGPPLRSLGVRQDDGWPTTPQALRAVLADAPHEAKSLLQALTWGPPVGTLGTELPDAARWLLDRHILHRQSATEVVLPREVALATRGGRLAREVSTEPPLPEAAHRAPDLVAAEAVAASDEVVREIDVLLHRWAQEPPSVLRAGGATARTVSALAADLGVSAGRAALVIELAGMVGLLGQVHHDDGTVWAPTPRAEVWREAPSQDRWAEVVTAWLRSARVPWLAGSRTEKGVLRAALAPDLHRSWAAPLRRRTLQALAAWPKGAAPSTDQVRDYLGWWTPRSVPPTSTVAAVLAEIAALGLGGAGALGPPARALLDGGAPDRLAADLEAIRPSPVRDLIIQGDLTGVVPGRPTAELAELLDASADIEGRGAALTVRFSMASVARALESGWTSTDLLVRLRAASLSGIPQPLEYLINDAARRHQRVRIQPASAVISTGDEASLLTLLGDPRLTHLGLRQIGPTTLVSDSRPVSVHDALQGVGASPALEGPDGRAVQVVPGRTRASRPAPLGEHPVESPVAAGAAIAAMRSGEARGAALLAGLEAAPSASDDLDLLRAAAERGTQVRIVVAGNGGTTHERVVRPMSVEAGRIRALDAAREAEITVATHRIVAVHPA